MSQYSSTSRSRLASSYAMVRADDDRYTFSDGDPPVDADGQMVVEPI